VLGVRTAPCKLSEAAGFRVTSAVRDVAFVMTTDGALKKFAL
jgi:hypothetical protein